MKILKSIMGFAVMLVICMSAFTFGTAYGGDPETALAAVSATFATDTAYTFAGLAGLIINQSTLSNLFIGFKNAFNAGFRSVETSWEKIATLVPSTTAEEKYGWLGQWPKLREWVGDRQVKGLEAHDYSIKNKKFESTVGVLRDNIEDDSYGVFSPLMQEMGFAAATHPDELVFNLLKNGFAKTCFDGQFYFDTDHPVGNEDTGIVSVSNMQAGAGNPWFLMDTRRPLKPLIFQRRRNYDFKAMTKADDENVFMRDEYRYGIDARVNVGYGFWQMAFGSKAALDATNFAAAYEAGMAFKSDEGRPLGVGFNLLVCGPSNRSAALEVVKTERNANGATNINRNAVEVLVVPWLD